MKTGIKKYKKLACTFLFSFLCLLASNSCSKDVESDVIDFIPIEDPIPDSPADSCYSYTPDIDIIKESTILKDSISYYRVAMNENNDIVMIYQKQDSEELFYQTTRINGDQLQEFSEPKVIHSGEYPTVALNKDGGVLSYFIQEIEERDSNNDTIEVKRMFSRLGVLEDMEINWEKDSVKVPTINNFPTDISGLKVRMNSDKKFILLLYSDKKNEVIYSSGEVDFEEKEINYGKTLLWMNSSVGNYDSAISDSGQVVRVTEADGGYGTFVQKGNFDQFSLEVDWEDVEQLKLNSQEPSVSYFSDSQYIYAYKNYTTEDLYLSFSDSEFEACDDFEVPSFSFAKGFKPDIATNGEYILITYYVSGTDKGELAYVLAKFNDEKNK